MGNRLIMLPFCFIQYENQILHNMRNLFKKEEAIATIARINQLTASTTPQWGKMNVGQMLAHCNVAYDMALTDKYPMAGSVKRFFLKLFVKGPVVGPKPYKRNGPTAPEFKITDERDFELEKNKLIQNIEKVQSLGTKHFEGKESNSFGALTSKEWNVLFSKHLDHHLIQFGV